MGIEGRKPRTVINTRGGKFWSAGDCFFASLDVGVWAWPFVLREGCLLLLLCDYRGKPQSVLLWNQVNLRVMILCEMYFVFFPVIPLSVSLSTTFAFHRYFNAGERNAQLCELWAGVEGSDTSTNFLCSEPANSAGTWLSAEVGYESVNNPYSVCGVCRFSCGMSIMRASILGASFNGRFSAGIATVTISPLLKVWIRWAALLFAARSKRCLDFFGFSVKIATVGFGWGVSRLYSGEKSFWRKSSCSSSSRSIGWKTVLIIDWKLSKIINYVAYLYPLAS